MPEWAWCQSNVAPCSMLWHRCAVAAALVVTRSSSSKGNKAKQKDTLQNRCRRKSSLTVIMEIASRHLIVILDDFASALVAPRRRRAVWPQPHAPPRSSPVVISSWWQDHQPPPSSSYQGPRNEHQLMGATPIMKIKQYSKLSDFKLWKLYDNQNFWYIPLKIMDMEKCMHSLSKIDRCTCTLLHLFWREPCLCSRCSHCVDYDPSE